MTGLTRPVIEQVKAKGSEKETEIIVSDEKLSLDIPRESTVSEVEYGFYDELKGSLVLQLYNGERIEVEGFPVEDEIPMGLTGPKGDDGAPGKQGVPGRDGLVGEPGCEGTRGDTGARGKTGLDGRKGMRGPAGIRGATGPQGPRGAAGSEGDIGPIGPTGPRGVDGGVGVPGEQGEEVLPSIVVSATDPGAVGPGVLWVDPTPPSYSIEPDSTNVDEGNIVTMTVTTTMFGSGTLCWTIVPDSGDIDEDDFNSAMTGSVSIIDNSGSFDIAVREDTFTEGTEKFKVRLHPCSNSGSVLDTSAAITINDTSRSPPTYSITPNVNNVNEGQSVTMTVDTTDYGTGTLCWTILPADGDINSDDFTGPISGSVFISNDSGSFDIGIREDNSTEGTEKFKVKLHQCSGSTASLAMSSEVTIGDTSLTPPTYAIAPNTTSINEGGTVTMTVTTAHYGSGTLCWTLMPVSGSVDSNDFTGSMSGSVSVSNDSGSFNIGIREDSLTEGLEKFKVKLHECSGSTATLAMSSDISIVDTSTTPATYSITPNITSVNEGGSVIMSVDTTDFGSGTLCWTILPVSGSLNSDDFTSSMSGSIYVSNDSASFGIGIKSDSLTEGTEKFKVKLHECSNTSALATTSAISINDTSLTPAPPPPPPPPPTFSIVPHITSVSEGGSVIMSVTTTNYGSGTLCWTIMSVSGSINSNDFTNSMNGSVSVSGDSGSFIIGIRNDALTEGTEKFKVKLHECSGTSALATSSDISIEDTSLSPPPPPEPPPPPPPEPPPPPPPEPPPEHCADPSSGSPASGIAFNCNGFIIAGSDMMHSMWSTAQYDSSTNGMIYTIPIGCCTDPLTKIRIWSSGATLTMKLHFDVPAGALYQSVTADSSGYAEMLLDMSDPRWKWNNTLFIDGGSSTTPATLTLVK